MKTIIALLSISDNVVLHMKTFKKSRKKQAEEEFLQSCRSCGFSEAQASLALEEGYFRETRESTVNILEVTLDE